MQKKEKSPPLNSKLDLSSDEQKVIESIKSNFSCAICLSITIEPCMTPCGHLFCSSCLSEWIHSNPEPGCPTCRRLFGVNSIVYLNGSSSKYSNFLNFGKKILKPGFSSQNMRYGNILICNVESKKPSLRSIGFTMIFSLLLMIFAEVITTNFKLERV